MPNFYDVIFQERTFHLMCVLFIVKDNNGFTLHLLQFSFIISQKCALEKAGENIILSPYSIEAALSLAAQGARDKTWEALKQSVHWTGTQEEIANEYSRQFSGLQKSKGPATKFDVANKVYVQENFKIAAPFKDVAVNKYASDVESVNFAENVLAANTINKWVEAQTNEKIKDLIKSDSVNGDTRMVLVNAVYFKGPWEKKFDPKLTEDDDFYVTKDVSKKIPFMNKKDDFYYGAFPDLGFTALSLRYNNSEFSFLILLPNERDGLAALEAQLDKIDLNDISSQLSSQEVNVHIPKFKIESAFGLKDTLSQVCLFFLLIFIIIVVVVVDCSLHSQVRITINRLEIMTNHY